MGNTWYNCIHNVHHIILTIHGYGTIMISFDRAKIRTELMDRFPDQYITESHITLFIEHIEVYAFSENMYDDFDHASGLGQ